jgi:hypothetical protein
MGRGAALAIGLGLGAIALALALPAVLGSGESADIGRFALVQAAPGVVYRIDTATGDAWVSAQGGDWRFVEESDSGPDETRRSAAKGRIARVP